MAVNCDRGGTESSTVSALQEAGAQKFVELWFGWWEEVCVTQIMRLDMVPVLCSGRPDTLIFSKGKRVVKLLAHWGAVLQVVKKS